MKSNSLPVLTDQASLASYLAKIKAMPMLEAQEEYMLAKRMIEHKDIKAAQKLVTSHLKLVVKIANQYRGYGLPMLEVISEGNIGLMQAVRKFDPELGFKLATYATWWIKASMQEYILKSWSLVKIGTTAAQKKLFFNLRRMKSKIYALEHREMNPDDIKQIAKELEVTENEVKEMNLRMLSHDLSLNHKIGNTEDDEVINFIPENRPNQEIVIINKNEQLYKEKLFKKALAELDARELKIVEERYLKDTPSTLEELSQMFMVSRERIRQLEERAVAKLKNYIRENY
ncbi:RNA polymerase sigma factor RpoH [Rickettsiales endosymbiont of Stachyamoeba lipophora]|uniref:RNA polymerase sigma factor RpoH n=1 Tax=Rickettsiales endosymbiont of Stachyamoeba lipophora TaxID=2486578 RepID=UPI000F649878|nr:RNA polymerase sigma factor RpoH [Rickettsiales endosymbiont of Stachyamoeba lipophora]AZL15751.1 RNA polymerase sigma factor RpoH [Rickettsiales endosymbiont of Stachyamoeba lipophora]